MGHEVAHAVAKHSVERASQRCCFTNRYSIIRYFFWGKTSQVNRTTGMDTWTIIKN